MSKSNGILRKSKLILLAENTEMSKSNGILNKSNGILLTKLDFSHNTPYLASVATTALE
jgi:hypothetical protein